MENLEVYSIAFGPYEKPRVTKLKIDRFRFPCNLCTLYILSRVP